MVSLIEELRNNFEVIQIANEKDFIRIRTGWFDTPDKAVNAMINLLKEKGYTKITLPYLPIPYIIDNREGNYQGVISIVE